MRIIIISSSTTDQARSSRREAAAKGRPTLQARRPPLPAVADGTGSDADIVLFHRNTSLSGMSALGSISFADAYSINRDKRRFNEYLFRFQ